MMIILLICIANIALSEINSQVPPVSLKAELTVFENIKAQKTVRIPRKIQLIHGK